MPKKSKFLTDIESSVAKKTVSARVPLSVYDAFARASEIAEGRLKITNVIEIAMKEAIAEVEKEYKRDCYSADMLE